MQRVIEALKRFDTWFDDLMRTFVEFVGEVIIFIITWGAIIALIRAVLGG